MHSAIDCLFYVHCNCPLWCVACDRCSCVIIRRSQSQTVDIVKGHWARARSTRSSLANYTDSACRLLSDKQKNNKREATPKSHILFVRQVNKTAHRYVRHTTCTGMVRGVHFADASYLMPNGHVCNLIHMCRICNTPLGGRLHCGWAWVCVCVCVGRLIYVLQAIFVDNNYNYACKYE